MVDTSKSPYYDDFDPAKKFMQILAVPGRAEQAREFTQAQTILLHIIKKLSDTILKEGSIVSGMAFSLPEDSNVLTVENGKVYLDGIIHDFEKQQIAVTKTGVENIGVKIIKEIVTETDDASLRDPAQGYENYSQPGAHRLRARVVLTLNDDTAPTIYRFVDGVLQVDPVKPQLDIISDILARRTYDESGNYKVSGLTLWAEDLDDDFINLNVEAGKAYILGYEVIKPASVKVKVNKAKDTRLIQNEIKTFVSGTNKYRLDSNPVKDITRVVAQVLVKRERMTRGSQVGGIDDLSKTSVSFIERVWVEDGTGNVIKEYVPDVDYQLVNSRSISWAPGGQEPNIGSTYYVTYRYNKTMEKGVDYVLAVEGTGDSMDKRYYVDFTPNLGVDPIPNTQFFVDYEFYLARKDLVSIDKDGNIIITKGQSDLPHIVTTPINNDPNILHLGTVYLPPNSGRAITNSYAVTRLSMEELQRVVQRVNDLEYNQAMTALDKEAMQGESPTNLRGIFSDGFHNTSKADLTHPDFNIAFSLETGEIVLPASDIRARQPNILPTSSVKTWGRIITAPMTEEATIQQPYATGTMLVNPYNVFNKMAILRLTPEVDNWVDIEKIVIEKQETATYRVHRWWYHGGTFWNDTEKWLFENLKLDAGQTWNGWNDITGTITTSSAKTILDEAVQFMRQREVQVEVKNLLPYANNLECYFDGIKVSLTPTNGTAAGTQPGTIKADGNGVAYGKFTIPAGIRTGTREVQVKNANNMAVASYTGQGRKRTIEETIIRTRVTVTPYDPLAQSFQFDTDKIISSVGLYFASKDPSKNITVQIRNMVNGYPGTIIYAEKILTPSQVAVSANGTAETKVTFDDPVLCKANTQYCVVIVTDSDAYSMFISELGKKDLVTNEYVTRQPYLAGTLFSSANALTWTAHQTQDLKFTVYTAKFASEGVVEFNPITGISVDRLVLFSEYLTPQNTGCSWEIKIKYEGDTDPITAKPYQPIGNYQDVELPKKAVEIQLRATFKTNNNMSPLLAKDGFNLIGFLTALRGSYIGRTVFNVPAYTTVKQIIEAHIPNGCTVKPSFSYDGGVTWVDYGARNITPVIEPTEDPNYTRYIYTYTIPGGKTSTVFKARVDMSSSNSWIRPRARKFMNIMK